MSEWAMGAAGRCCEHRRGADDDGGGGGCVSWLQEVIGNCEMTSPPVFLQGFVWRVSWPRPPAAALIKRPRCACAHQLSSGAPQPRCWMMSPCAGLPRLHIEHLHVFISWSLPDSATKKERKKCLFRPSASRSGSPLLAGIYSGKRKPTECLLTLSSPANPAETEEGPIRRSSPLPGPRRT